MQGELTSCVYIHGRGDAPSSPPGDVVLEALDPRAPEYAPCWFAGPFEGQLAEVARRMEGARLAVGHSFGAYLILAAGPEKAAPAVVLLCPLLGRAGGASGFIAPRAAEVRAALGLDGGAPAWPTDRVRFWFGEDDLHADPADIARLDALGFEVVRAAGGHRLLDPEARARLRTYLLGLA